MGRDITTKHLLETLLEIFSQTAVLDNYYVDIQRTAVYSQVISLICTAMGIQTLYIHPTLPPE